MPSLREKAMDYLSRREHSRIELKNKLLEKNFPEVDVDAVLDKLIADDLQSDARFAESYVRSRKLAGFGPKRIALELRERGVAQSIVDDAVDARSTEWQSQLYTVWRKKFARAPNTPQSRQQQFRFLFYRGYTSEAISICLATAQIDISEMCDIDLF